VLLPEQLRRAIWAFYARQSQKNKLPGKKSMVKKEEIKPEKKEYLHQCSHCLSVYDESAGEPDNGIAAGTPFEKLAATYHCTLCEAPKEDFRKIDKSKLGLQTV
jgi:rubredoxin